MYQNTGKRHLMEEQVVQADGDTLEIEKQKCDKFTQSVPLVVYIDIFGQPPKVV